MIGWFRPLLFLIVMALVLGAAHWLQGRVLRATVAAQVAAVAATAGEKSGEREAAPPGRRPPPRPSDGAGARPAPARGATTPPGHRDATPPTPSAGEAPIPPRPVDFPALVRWAQALARSPRPEARAALWKALEATDVLVERMALARAISEWPRPDDGKRLQELCRDPNPNVGLLAARGLLLLGRTEVAMPILLGFAERGTPALSAFASGASRAAETRRGGRGRIFLPPAIDYCLAAIRSPHASVQVEAAGGLLDLGRTTEGLAVLETHIRRDSPSLIRLAAVMTLGSSLHVDGARALLERCRDDPDPAVRATVEEILGRPPP